MEPARGGAHKLCRQAAVATQSRSNLELVVLLLQVADLVDDAAPASEKSVVPLQRALERPPYAIRLAANDARHALPKFALLAARSLRPLRRRERAAALSEAVPSAPLVLLDECFDRLGGG